VTFSPGWKSFVANARHKKAAMSDGHFLQFPLCALAFGQTVNERLDAIISYGNMNAGQRSWDAMMKEERDDWVATVNELTEKPSGFKKQAHVSYVVLLGNRIVGIQTRNIESVVWEHAELTRFRAEFESRNGPDALVRVGTDLLFETRDSGFSYRLFSIICAYNSMQGRTINPVLIRRPMWGARAFGYKSPAVMEKEWPNRIDSAERLTVRRLRDTLDEAEARKFFKRVNPSRRSAYYYPVNLDDDRVIAAIVHRKTIKDVASNCRQQLNKKIKAGIARVKEAEKVADGFQKLKGSLRA
jgi:hypothetical protein